MHVCNVCHVCSACMYSCMRLQGWRRDDDHRKGVMKLRREKSARCGRVCVIFIGVVGWRAVAKRTEMHNSVCLFLTWEWKGL